MERSRRGFAVDPQGDLQRIVALGGGTGPELYLRKGYVHFSIQCSDAFTACGSSSFQPDTWVHVAGVWTGSSMTVYIDGVKGAVCHISVSTVGKGMVVGGDDARRAGSSFKGVIADVRLWSSDRNEKEIADGMTTCLTGKEPGLLGYWPLGDASANYRSDGGEREMHVERQAVEPAIGPRHFPRRTYVVHARVGDRIVKTKETIASHRWSHLAAVYKQSHAVELDGKARPSRLWQGRDLGHQSRYHA